MYIGIVNTKGTNVADFLCITEVEKWEFIELMKWTMHMSKLQSNIDLNGIKKNIQIQRLVVYKKRNETQ